MRHDDDREPIFVRSRSGTPHYTYNLKSPVGVVLAVVSLAIAGVCVLAMKNSVSLSENELRDAVYTAAEALEQEPRHGPSAGGYSSLIREALDDAMADSDNTVRPVVDAVGDHDDYEITGSDSDKDTDAVYCMQITSSVSQEGGISIPMEDGGSAVVHQYDLSVSVSEGRCS